MTAPDTNATDAGANSVQVQITPNEMTASVYTGDPDWTNYIDGVDTMFQKSGTGTSTTYTLKATNPGTFKYKLSLENETGIDIHTKGKPLPNVIRNGMSIKDANGGTTTVFLTVPSMPTNVGVSTYPLDLRPTGTGRLPAHRLVAGLGTPGRPVGRHADHRLLHRRDGRLAVGLGLLDRLGLSAPAGARRQRRGPVHPDRRPRDPEAPLRPTSTWRTNSAGRTPATGAAPPIDPTQQFRAGFNFRSTTAVELDGPPLDVQNRFNQGLAKLPVAARQPYVDQFNALWNKDYIGNTALGLTFAGERTTAVGGFVFDPSGNGRTDITVRVYKTVPANANRCNPTYDDSAANASAANLAAWYTTGSDGFYFIWQTAREHRGRFAEATRSRAGSSTTSRCAT